MGIFKGGSLDCRLFRFRVQERLMGVTTHVSTVGHLSKLVHTENKPKLVHFQVLNSPVDWLIVFSEGTPKSY